MLLTALWSGFCVPNRIRLAVFGRWRSTTLPSLLHERRYFLVAVMDRLSRSNADGTKCIRAVLSDDESIGDGRNVMQIF
jgi:hypothetical protein